MVRRGDRQVRAIKTLIIELNSRGGNVWDGSQIYNILAQHPAKKIVKVGALAASAGSVVAMAGNEIHIPANGMMMLHDPWSNASGRAVDMRAAADMLDKIKVAMIAAYKAFNPSLTDEKISEIMTVESWYTGAEAVEAGWATKVLEPVNVQASVPAEIAARYKNAPAALVVEASVDDAQEAPKDEPADDKTAPAPGGIAETAPKPDETPEVEKTDPQADDADAKLEVEPEAAVEPEVAPEPEEPKSEVAELREQLSTLTAVVTALLEKSAPKAETQKAEVPAVPAVILSADRADVKMLRSLAVSAGLGSAFDVVLKAGAPTEAEALAAIQTLAVNGTAGNAPALEAGAPTPSQEQVRVARQARR